MAMSRLEGWRSLITLPVEPDFAFGNALQPGNRVEQGRLAAAGRADQDQEPALFQFDVDALEYLEGAETLLQRIDFEKGHGLTP